MCYKESVITISAQEKQQASALWTMFKMGRKKDITSGRETGGNVTPGRTSSLKEKKRNDGHLLFRWSHEKFAFECGTRAVCPTADGQAASNKQKGVCMCTYCVGKERHENSVSPGKVFFCVGSRGKCKCDSGTRQQRLVASPMFSVFL